MYEIKPVKVQYPTGVRKAINAAARAWVGFSELPLASKEKFVFVEGQTNGDAGYEMRRKPGEDPKETFMLTGSSMSRFWDIPIERNETEVYMFLSTFHALELKIFPFLRNYVEKIAKEFSLGDEYVQRTLKNRNKWSFRFLHYLPGATGDIIASAHADRGGFTPHLYESTPGLEWLIDPAKDQWLPMDMSSLFTVIIPGMQLQYISEGRVKAVCHRVVSTPQSKAHGRFSLVVFVDSVDTPVYNKALAGRSQDLVPGSNYTMPWVDFRKMFK